MAIVSKYSNEQVETLMSDLLGVLEKHHANTDLALMALGNAATVIINGKIAPEHRATLAQQFAKALAASIETKA
ncbi:DUF1414 domain-containing protein [Ferrimonas gelatinilytica]|uniref:UPF0352 protein GCM10025772_05390 n=1 Tax=Ferrimonas gelatinilytica TaxID=1255257 RepID=A0ABP9RVY6_9GAMM